MLAFDPFALAVALAALLVDAVVGDPPALYRRVPHPVAMLGKGIEILEARLNDASVSDAGRLVRGGAAALLVIAAAAGVGALVHALASAVPAGAFVEAAAASILVAFRGLRDHVGEVARGLESGIAEARAAVAHLVGRDPASLDEPGVARAAIESLAENFADGVVAPLFWYVLLGFPGLLGYKAINTLDSMIGHRDPRYRWFGRVAARVDDAANWIPARLAAALLAGAALAHARRKRGRRRSRRPPGRGPPPFGERGLARGGDGGRPRIRHRGAPALRRAPRRGRVDGGRAARPRGAKDVRAALRHYALATALLAALLAAGWAAGWAAR